jgi:apolipoprotein N-acyltransferase
VVVPLDGNKVGAFICYESAFPHLVRRFTSQGAQVLANLSFDGFFGDSSARRQHLSLARMRAAENGRWLLRATSDGITAVINPAGRVVQRLPQHQELALPASFNFIREQTLYTRWGDWFVYVCLALTLGGFFFPRQKPAS